MVTRTRKGTGTRRRAAPPAARRAPAAPAMRAPRVAQMRVRLGMAGEQVQVAGLAATRFARSSMREMSTAARASREPMHALWRNMRLAGRHIVRDAVELWKEVRPAAMEGLKWPGARRARRPAA